MPLREDEAEDRCSPDQVGMDQHYGRAASLLTFETEIMFLIHRAGQRASLLVKQMPEAPRHIV